MSHRKRALAALAVAAFALAGASVAGAQMKVEVTPFAGYNIASDIYNGYSATGGSGNIELLNGLLWGGRLTFSSPRGGFELAYTRITSEIQSESALQDQPRSKWGTLSADLYDINFLGYQPSGNARVTPFGLIGFGWAVTHPEFDSDFVTGAGAFSPESNTLFNFNFGLGAKIEMSEKIGLRLEGRWRVTDTAITTSSGIWCDPWGYCYSYASDWYNSGELIGGISYAFR